MPTLKIFNEMEARHLVFHHNMAVPKLDKNIGETSKDETRTRGTRPAAAPPRPTLPPTRTRTITSTNNTTFLCPYPAPATSTGQNFGIVPPNPLHNDRKRKKETTSREQEDRHQAILVKKQQQEQEQVMMKNKIRKYERLHMMTDITTTSFCKKSNKKNNEAPPSSNNTMSFHEEAALSRTLVPAAPLAQPHPMVCLRTTRNSDQHQPGESISTDEFSTRDFKNIVDEKESPAGRAPLKAHENADAENEEARYQQLENILAPISPDTIKMKTRNKLVLKWCPVCNSCEQSCCGEMKKRDEETTNTIIVQSKRTKNEMLENLPPSAAGNEILSTSDMIFRAKNNILSMIKTNESNASINISPPELFKYDDRDRSIMPPPKHRDSSALKGNHGSITQHVPYRANDVPCIPSEPRVAAHYSRSQPLLTVPPRTTFHPPVPSGSACTNYNISGEGFSKNDMSQQNGFLTYPSQQGSQYLTCPTPAKPQQGNYSEHPSRLVVPAHNGNNGNPSAYCYNGPNSRSIAPTSNEIQPSTLFQFALFYPNEGFMY